MKWQNQEMQCSARASALEALVQKCISEPEDGYYCVEDVCVVWLSYRLSRSREDTAAEYRHRKETELEEEARSTESGARPAWDVSLAKQPRDVHTLLWSRHFLSQPQSYVHAAAFAKIPTLHSLKQQARRLAGGLLHSATTACKAAMGQCLNLTKIRGLNPSEQGRCLSFLVCTGLGCSSEWHTMLWKTPA